MGLEDQTDRQTDMTESLPGAGPASVHSQHFLSFLQHEPAPPALLYPASYQHYLFPANETDTHAVHVTDNRCKSLISDKSLIRMNEEIPVQSPRGARLSAGHYDWLIWGNLKQPGLPRMLRL